MSECSCEKCKSACWYIPGWFIPTEIPKLAGFLGMSEQEVFDKYLRVDWWGEPGDTYVIGPTVLGEDAGSLAGTNPRGVCVFFDLSSGCCSVHAVKPYECRESTPHDGTLEYHELAKIEWQNTESQRYIEDLLGCDPATIEIGDTDYCDFFGNYLGMS